MSRSLFQMVAVIMLLVVGATGCATVEDNPKASIGALAARPSAVSSPRPAGGGGAAIAGAVIGGALLGGFAGNALDQRDKRLAAEAQQRALETAPTGKPVAWTNPDTGHSGTITPTKTYQANGAYCREFQSDVIIDGKPDKAWGTACRQPDGSWKVQS
jgi:surface antigen